LIGVKKETGELKGIFVSMVRTLAANENCPRSR